MLTSATNQATLAITCHSNIQMPMTNLAASISSISCTAWSKQLSYLFIGILLTVNGPISSHQHGSACAQVFCHSTSRSTDSSHVLRPANVTTSIVAPVPVLQGGLDEGIIIYHGCRVVAFIVGVQAVTYPLPMPLWPADQC